MTTRWRDQSIIMKRVAKSKLSLFLSLSISVVPLSTTRSKYSCIRLSIGKRGFCLNKLRVGQYTVLCLNIRLYTTISILLWTLQRLNRNFFLFCTLDISCNSCFLSIKFVQGINISLLIRHELF